MSQKKAIR